MFSSIAPAARRAAQHHFARSLFSLAVSLFVCHEASADDPASATDPVTDTAVPVPAPAPAAPPVAVSRSVELDTVTVISKRFEQARNRLSPSAGSSEYVFDRQSIQNLAQGDHTPLNEVILQAPGVAADSYGQIHVRGDHLNLQYRIDGLIIPEGINGFGPVLDTRFAERVDFLTGALPAQYGYRTAGVIDITPRKTFEGGVVDVYGGDHGTLNPSAQYGYSRGNFSAYVVGSYLGSSLGLESPTSARNPVHDQTTQGKGFGYLSYVLSPNLKVSGLFGSSYNKFEIPTIPDVPTNADYEQQSCGGPCGFNSAGLNDRQFERNTYGLLALRGLGDAGETWQVSVFNRVSQTVFQPDQLGELVLNGLAASINRKSSTAGVQADLSYPILAGHTLRAGLFGSTEDDRSDNTSVVFQTQSNPPACPPGYSNSVDPKTCIGPQVTVVDNNPKNGNTLFGVYVQDQWDVSDQFILNYGLRYDRVNAFIKASQWSPRVGMVWHAAADTTLHAGYARYFTPPPNELISNTTLSRFNNTTAAQSGANDPIQAERSHYIDVGILQNITPTFSVGLDNYYKRVSQLLDEGQFGTALIFTPFNYSQAKVYGTELSLNFHKTGFSAYANVALSRALGKGIDSAQFNPSPETISYTQDHYIHLDHDQFVTGSGGLSYVWKRATFSLTDLFGGGLRTGLNNPDGSLAVPNGAHLPFYNRLDAGVARKVDFGAAGLVELRLAAINILDHSYQIRDGGGVGVGAPQYGPRSAFYFGIAKTFNGG